MNLRSRKKLKILLLFVFTTLFLSSCTGQALDKLWLKSDGWSRGVLMGETAMASPMEPVIDPSGKVYSVLFPRSAIEDGLYQPQLAVLSPDAQFRTLVPLDFQINQPREAKLILIDGGLDLFWIESNQLKAVQLNERGERLSEIMILSTEERVAHLEVVRLKDGYEIWYSGSQENPGIYALSGEMGNLEKNVMDSEGIEISLFVDAENQLHASWSRYPLSYG
ncbi:MAG TPA: hypothetical protein ENF22_00840, partial [Chloroflexi bacterium]|nr:hypothetical protein [Chloroflexota bacterium]